MHRKHILWNSSFELSEDEIDNMNKTYYSDLHTQTKAKGTFILAEYRKNSKTNKVSDKKSQKKIVLERLMSEIINLKNPIIRKRNTRVTTTL